MELRETVYNELPGVADGVIKGAKLLGIHSRNGRRYESAALEKATSLYEGRQVFVNHPDPDDTGKDRQLQDWAGVIENVQYRKGDGLYGDIVLRQESAHFKGIVEAASHPKFRKSCGFSHVAEGESRLDGDTEIVESIKEVFSVDLVTSPATTAGIYESKKSRTVKQAIESLPEGKVRKRLIEMVDGGYIDGEMSMDSGKEESQDPLAQQVSLTKELIRMLGETLKALAMKKDTPPPVAPPAADPNANPQKDPNADPGADENAEAGGEEKKKPPFESLQRELAMAQAKNLLLESGREATPARIKALVAVEEADREGLLESWPQEAEAALPFRSPALIESAGDTEFDFTQPGSFARRYA